MAVGNRFEIWDIWLLEFFVGFGDILLPPEPFFIV